MTNPKIGLITQNKSDRSIDALAFLELGGKWSTFLTVCKYSFFI